ncbi:MAG: response regulator [Chthoniobacterales bacterium]|nr:response regulator [Chthoniobacterales bacterium]
MSTTPLTLQSKNDRILIIDDNPSIHEDFRKILGPADVKLAAELDADEAALFGETGDSSRPWSFQIDSAFQGQEGLEKVRTAFAEGEPYAVAFVDVRMPPGWDGIETISRIWKEFPDLQIVICTAYSDYSWDEIAKSVGNTDQMLVLKKPFDNVEVLQMAHALAKKWQLTQIARRQMEELDALVNQRTVELRTANARLTGEVAERTAAEEALRKSEERFSKAFHSSPIPMVIQQLDGKGCLDANVSFLELLSAERDAVLAGTTIWWADDATAAALREKLAARHVVRNLTTAIRTAEGEDREVLVAAENLELGSIPYHLLILQDITDRMRLENELRQAQKMEAVGRLAAGVAHDFNNILTVILGNTSMQLRNPHLDEKLSASLQQVERAAERATALTRQLLAYSRKQIIQRRSLALNDVVEQTVAMFRRIIGEHIALDMQLTPDLPPIFADSSSVDQVIMNLALNARDAMPDGGKLTLATVQVDFDETTRAGNPEAQLGPHICLAVKDTGYGMDAATVARIFEPFFTTKGPGEGTGMGLATVYGVLKQHGGWVEVESAPRRGTTVRVFFPLSPEGAAAEPRTAERLPAQCAPTNAITILVVEDEEMLREFVSEALGALGYRVLSAANGRAALEVWAEHQNEIDLLLTDVVMPESISGRELAHTLVMDKPDLKVIFTSGYSAELIGTDFEQEKRHAFLAKPYLPDRLAQTVAAHLQSQPAMTASHTPVLATA